MVNAPINATGWSELMDGKMVPAVYKMFDGAFGGIGMVILILFLLYQFILYQKTGNVTLMWVTGVLFAGLFATSQLIPATALTIILVILVLEFAAIFYLIFFS